MNFDKLLRNLSYFQILILLNLVIAFGTGIFFYTCNAHIKFDIQDLYGPGLSIIFLSFLYALSQCQGWHKNIELFIQSLIIIVLIPVVFGVLQYAVMYQSHDFIDHSLDGWDSQFSFNTKNFVTQMRHFPTIKTILDFIYTLPRYEIYLVIVYLSYQGNRIKLHGFMLNNIIAFVLIFTGVHYCPALGPFDLYGIEPTLEQADTVKKITVIRSGLIDFDRIYGTVTFPSYHTILALLIIDALRTENKWLLTVCGVINALVLISCLSTGWHYLIDIIAGLLITFIIIGLHAILRKKWVKNDDR